MRYRVSCFAREDWTEGMCDLSAQEAIAYADAFLADHAFGAVHIFAEGSDNGIFIARPDDGALMTQAERIDLLQRTRFTTNPDTRYAD